jgi:hypothetical protein
MRLKLVTIRRLPNRRNLHPRTDTFWNYEIQKDVWTWIIVDSEENIQRIPLR